jgi:hypothetical protein
MRTKTRKGNAIKETLKRLEIENRPKSKIAQYWESEDRLGLEIVDMRAVLK